MILNHVNLEVRDFNAAVRWFATILGPRASFHSERVATFSFQAMTIVIDAAAGDAPATLGFESDDCDRAFQAIIARGAAPIEEPVNKEWGVRTAYFKGPGAITCEIEGPIANVYPRLAQA